MTGRYDDLLALPHHVSPGRARLTAAARAAQFAPFAALTGYDAVVAETARLTTCRAELDEDERAALDCRLQALAARLDEQPEARITYFQPDARKAGGAYCTVAGRVKNIDLYTREVVLASGQRIAIDEIVQVV